jgi:hypothetical protein
LRAPQRDEDGDAGRRIAGRALDLLPWHVEMRMNANLLAATFAFLIFVGMFASFEFGRSLCRRHVARGDGASGFAALQGGVSALLGLLVAFSFSGAAARFDTRRQLIVEEANAIGTAFLRLDLLPADARPAMRALFRQYADARIAVYKAGQNEAATEQPLAQAGQLQIAIWRHAVAIGQVQNSAPILTLLLPALNRMIDVTNERAVAAKVHPPWIIFAMLAVVGWATAGLAGESAPEKSWTSRRHFLMYAAIFGLIIYVIAELELPRAGLIRIEAFDQALTDVRQSMGSE